MSATRYDETRYAYDLLGRQNRVLSPGGTITRTTLDARGRTLGVYVGTSDAAATDDDPTGDGHPANNMVQVTGYAYEAACGCGQPSSVTQFVDADPAHDRVTSSTLDFRHRVVAIDGELDFYQVNTHDNLGRTIQVDRRDTTSGGHLIARTETLYDAQGRVYQVKRHAVDPDTGTPGNVLIDRTWYDAAGNAVKQQPAGSRAFTKTEYDSQARVVGQYVGYYTESGAEGKNLLVDLGLGQPNAGMIAQVI